MAGEQFSWAPSSLLLTLSRATRASRPLLLLPCRATAAVEGSSRLPRSPSPAWRAARAGRRHPGGRAAIATGSLLLAPGSSAGSEQLAADPGRQEGAEVVALRREVAALKEKIGRLESVLEGQL